MAGDYSFNILGALFVAFVFGHFLGLTASGSFKEEVIEVAHAKLAATPYRLLFQELAVTGLLAWRFGCAMALVMRQVSSLEPGFL